MSDRGAFEAEEIRGLASRYGGVRKYSPDGIGYYQFSPTCWCCPHWDNDTMQPPEQEGEPWKCSRGCAPSIELRDCPNALPGHAGYRHVRRRSPVSDQNHPSVGEAAQVLDLEQRMGGDVLKLEFQWSRRGKVLSGNVELFKVESGGRVICPYCGDRMRIAAFRQHYPGCRDEAGEEW